MTIPSTARKAGPLLGTGVQTAWPFTFKVFATADVAVTTADSLGVETVLVLDTDYSVTLNANQETSPGGTVTYPLSGTPLSVGSKLSITGDIDYDQPLDLPSGGNFSPLALENELDRVLMQIQQLDEGLGRTLQVAVTSDADPTLPTPESSALIGWNTTGTALENIPLAGLGTALGYGTFRTEVFTGNGSTTQFALLEDPVTMGNLVVVVDGLTYRPTTDYTLLLGIVVFTVAPSNGAEIMVRYGEALPIGTANASDVTFNPSGTGAVATTVQTKLRETVSVKDFGAVGDGVTNDTAAIQAAITALRAAGGGTLVLANGASYLLNGIAGADGILNGILMPYNSDNGSANRIFIEGNMARLLAGSNNMILLHTSDSHNGARNLVLSGNGKTGVTGHAIYPESTTQTVSVVSQSYNRFDNFYITNCSEALALKCGPFVTSLASGCYYNNFTSYKIYSCIRGIWLRSPTNANGSLVNRNSFNDCRIGQVVANTGVQIDSGDTNTFSRVHCEIVAYGTTPNAVPTAFKIQNTCPTTGLANLSNLFLSCKSESSTRDLENANSYTEFYGCLMTGAKSVYTAKPRVMVGGSDASVIPQIFNEYTYQNGAYLAGVDLNVLWLSGGLANGSANYVYDQSFKWATYPITTSNATNTSSIVQYYSKYQRLGGIVDFHCRFKFQATVATTSVVLTLPRTPSTQYTTFGSLQPSFIPVVVVGAFGAISVGYARFEDLSANLTIYAPTSNWHAGASSEIHIQVRFMETGF